MRNARNSPASPEATGLEVDKLNRSYVKTYFDNYLGQYKDTVGPLIDPSWRNFCRAGRKLYNFFDPPRQLREGLHMLPLLSLMLGQPEMAALFSLTDAALYASEGNIKGTILAGLGALPIAGLVGKAAQAGDAVLYRLITETEPVANFVSNAAKGLAPRGPEIGNALIHQGISMFNSLEKAMSRIPLLERGGKSVLGVAQVVIPHSAPGISIVKTLGAGHYTVTGNPATITGYWLFTILR